MTATMREVQFVAYEFGNPMPIGSVTIFAKPTEAGPRVKDRALRVARQKYQGRKGINVREIESDRR